MPSYGYECSRCGRETDEIHSVNTYPRSIRCRCGGKAVRVIGCPAVWMDGRGGNRGFSKSRREIRELERTGRGVCVEGMPAHKVQAMMETARAEGLRDHLGHMLDDIHRKCRDPAYVDAKQREYRRERKTAPVPGV